MKGDIALILLVIDIQKGITDERLYDFDGLIKNTVKIFEIAAQVTPMEGKKYISKI